MKLSSVIVEHLHLPTPQSVVGSKPAHLKAALGFVLPYLSDCLSLVMCNVRVYMGMS